MVHRPNVRASRLIALALRHDPAALGITLDQAGFTDVTSLLAALSARGATLARSELEELVRSSDKQRFVLTADRARIRASHGHSVDVDLGLIPETPPQHLYHGTVAKFLNGIREEGLIAGGRRFVHLSTDVATAEVVARRRGRPVVVLVLSGQMHRAGHALFLSASGIWLTEHVPRQFLEFPS
ncbi:MAG TPA: RNA 2'-phosphotransferase [Vicinamibacterales bacterium]|jgi:putative RNA 2'-phosphotransferase